MNVATGTIRAAAVRDRIRESGTQLVWAIVDSGISRRHVHFQRYSNLDLPDGLEHIDLVVPAGEAPAPLFDSFHHGSLLAGILAGEVLGDSRVSSGLPLPAALKRSRGKKVSRDMSGVAPACRLLSVKVLDANGEADEATVIEGLRRIQTINDFGRVIRVHGVLLGLGGEFDSSLYPCGMSPLCIEVDRLVRMGVCVVVPAGNEGLSDFPSDKQATTAVLGSISDPGNADLAITVGSTHREIPELSGVSYFSSKGPTRDGRPKPDLVAPGERIHCPFPNDRVKSKALSFDYKEESGTTMAAAFVAGAAAALQSVYPELIGRPLDLKQILMESATDLRRDRNFQGRGLLNVEAALALAEQRLRPGRESAALGSVIATHSQKSETAPSRVARPRLVRLMCSYSHADLTLWEELQKHLAGLKHQGLLETWYDQEIDAGQDWSSVIDNRLNSSDVFLLMVSSYFMDSDYCWSIEMTRAMERHDKGTAIVIPVVVRPCDWQSAPFAKLEAVPRKGKQPVTSFGDQHEAWSEVTKKVRAVVERLAFR